MALHIKIITVGKVKDRDLRGKIADYTKRIGFDARITFHEVKDTDKETEGKKISALLKKENGHVFALSEEGREYTSIQFAEKMGAVSGTVIFIIGGPFGLSAEVKERANELLSLSRMTFSHEMALLFLLEQIYRGISINLNRKYHKE